MADIIKQYYQYFNEANFPGMLSLLDENVVHEPCQGSPRQGKEKFTEFLAHMDNCYIEKISNPVIFYNADQSHAAAEFQLEGTYKKTDSDLPPAKNQNYKLRVGAFFEIKNGKITRVSNHYNLQDWIDQVK